ncbi:MAG TPA: cytochrome c oxidase subunit I [Acidobacteria bacterium]|jgi:cytochrome c oxidase subunit 1|nr:cbb3-type cytochrome c oxidase subunit I [Vicinamibacterales bacterium]HAK54960.1 cytochrome c oxidase subunit I [Acidobacteriota bacterium]|tara:strand:- start:2445 stop:4196 length:1752 start_codon:yes stop_codon:yes gene_type:complete
MSEAHDPGFIRRYIFSTDHKIIGIQYILTGLVMGMVGGLLAVLIRIQLGWPTAQWELLERLMPRGYPSGFMAPEFYISVVTMHGTIMVFFFISYVLVSGFGNYLVPLQVGAKDMAYPLLNMLSYWFALLSAVVMMASFLVEGGAAAAGWTAYPPLSAIASAVPGSGLGQSIWLVSMAIFIASFTMSGLNVVATIFTMRAPGMTMMRLPLTIWSYFIAAILGLLAFPPLTAAAVLLLFDRHLGTSFFLPSGLVVAGQPLSFQGGSPLLWQHLFWFLGHPEVYVLILPALGIVGDVLPAFTRKPVFGYRLNVYSLIAVGVLSMVVWGHHMFVSGMSPFTGEYFTLATMVITIPMTVYGVNLVASLFGGRMRLATPMLFSLAAVALFGSGGFGGLFLGNATADMQLHDTYFVVGHFHFMIGGVTLMGTFAALYFWFPKMFGRSMHEGFGKLHFWGTFAPFFMVFFGQHFLGLQGMPRRYYAFNTYEYLEGTAGQNTMLSVLVMVLVAAQFVFMVNFLWSLFKGQPVEANPWAATTLEWTVASPPPHGNFGDTLPAVHRWAYEYSPDGTGEDFAPQTAGPNDAPITA